MEVFVVVVIGLMLGSFLSVLLARWPGWRGVLAGRSHCTACSHTLAWYELVPLVSWLVLRGRCRSCRAGISALYPTLELTMAGVLGVFAFLRGTVSWWSALDLLIVASLVALFFFDLRKLVLPDIIVALVAVLATVRAFGPHPVSPTSSFLAAAILVAILGAGYFASKGRWLGFGDVKLALVIGLLFGMPSAIGVTILAIWAGALAGVVLVAMRRATRKTQLPFGSFWTAVAIYTLIWPALAAWLGRIFTLSLT